MVAQGNTCDQYVEALVLDASVTGSIPSLLTFVEHLPPLSMVDKDLRDGENLKRKVKKEIPLTQASSPT